MHFDAWEISRPMQVRIYGHCVFSHFLSLTVVEEVEIEIIHSHSYLDVALWFRIVSWHGSLRGCAWEESYLAYELTGGGIIPMHRAESEGVDCWL